MDDPTEKLKLEDLDQYRRKHGAKNAMRVLSFLGKNAAFVTAIRTELGQSIMQDLVVRMEYLLEKVIQGTITEEERLEYKISRGILESWAAKIAGYEKAINKLKKGG